MCGRYTVFDDSDIPELQILLKHARATGLPFATGEVFPSDPAMVVLEQDRAPLVSVMRWGYTGSSSRLLINARAETAAQKPTFCADLSMRRCVIPTTGFFEWSHDADKQKYLFTLDASPLLYLGGIWRPSPEGGQFAILTTAANDSMRPYHHRMPVLLSPSDVRPWLADAQFAQNLLLRTPCALRSQAVL
ncbi:MAG: SOS response-associated peptidase [Ruminococcaceae bacterium]|nr:SOS response-associated peptidase [Oscillospiraceae bacterium]